MSGAIDAKNFEKMKLREALPKSMQHSGANLARDEHTIQPIKASAHNMDDNILLAAKDALTYKAIELGLSGNGSMLKLCLERISIVEAKRTIIKIPPIRSIDDALEALSLITQACASGAISASDGEGLARLVGVTSAALKDVELLRRLEALEESESYEESQGPQSTNWCARTAEVP